MFGYLRLDARCPKQLRQEYKKYYCYLCRELQYHYGLISRFLLSYDVAFFALFCADELFLSDIHKIPCFKTESTLKAELSKETGLHLASLNILLTDAKLEDNILDEGGLKAHIVRFLLGPVFRKARRNDSLMHDIITEECAALRKLETENAGIDNLEESFSRMMLRLATECFNITDQYKLNSLEAAAKWLYYIDAVDDLDDDIKDGSFNALKQYKSFSYLKNCRYNELFDHLKSLYTATGIPHSKKTPDIIINRLLFFGIPEVTVKTLSKKRD